MYFTCVSPAWDALYLRCPDQSPDLLRRWPTYWKQSRSAWWHLSHSCLLIVQLLRYLWTLPHCNIWPLLAHPITLTRGQNQSISNGGILNYSQFWRTINTENNTTCICKALDPNIHQIDSSFLKHPPSKTTTTTTKIILPALLIIDN